MAADTKDVKNRIFNTLCSGERTPQNCKAVYIDGTRYRSLFVAGIDSDVSFRWLSQKLGETQGAPVLIKDHLVVSEDWVKEHLECLF